jgi:hypothetical protein
MKVKQYKENHLKDFLLNDIKEKEKKEDLKKEKKIKIYTVNEKDLDLNEAYL